MSAETEKVLAEARAARAALRAKAQQDLTRVRADLAARGVGGRIADKAKADATALGRDALAVAKDSKGVIAGIIGALALWGLRRPIVRSASALLTARRREPGDGTP